MRLEILYKIRLNSPKVGELVICENQQLITLSSCKRPSELKFFHRVLYGNRLYVVNVELRDRVGALVMVCSAPWSRGLDAAPPTLNYVIGFFRHGTRSPFEHSLKNDPNKVLYEKISGGYLGGLTEVGKKEMYNVGKSLKTRYETLVGGYREDKVRVTSTGIPRTVMSALCVMAGMFPPDPRIFKNLDWQPISVWLETLELNMAPLCPKYAKLATEGFKIISSPDPRPENKKIYELTSKYVQYDVNCIQQMIGIYDTLVAISRNHLLLPDWATLPQPELENKPLFPDLLKRFSEDSFQNTMFYDRDEDMLNIFLLPIFHEIQDSLIEVFSESSPEKMWYHSTHDTTIYVMLRALGLDGPVTAEPGDGLVFEVHRDGDKKIVKIFLFDADQHTLSEVTSPHCPAPCTIEYFVARFAPLTKQQMRAKCFGEHT